MPIDPRWDQLTPSDWQEFARTWLAALRGEPEAADSDIGQTVVMMNFMAAPEHQWQFITAAVAEAQSGDELGHIAAGPMEHLLGWHGPNYIDAVEGQAAADPKFARMLATVQRYMMGDEVWARIEALKVPGDRSDHA
jgi:hypothetical protein